MTKAMIWKIMIDSDECPHKSNRTCYCAGTQNDGKQCRYENCPRKIY